MMQSPIRSEHADDNGFAPRAGFCPFDLRDAESTLGERFRATAILRGSAIAVVDGDSRVSYTELLRQAEAVSQDLRSRCGSSGGVVAICLPSGIATVATMLGALLGEFAYFCLDPSLPQQQCDRLLQAAGPVTIEDGEEKPRDISGMARPIETRGPMGTAVLYATSGSEGEPKMVALSHRAVLFDIGRQTNDLYLGPDDRFDSLFSFAFSASLATIFGALLNGAEVHLHDPRHNMTTLPAWITERRITISTMTVSMLRHICMVPPAANAFAEMRMLSVGGEALHSADVDAFRSTFPPTCVLQNAMAATETRTYTQYFVPRSGPVESPVPIGWPVMAKDVELLDETGTPVPFGSEGEIAIRSRYLASGYANDPDRTALKFEAQQNGLVLYRTGDRGFFRPDGCLVFLGRADSQAKIRGYRVELDHIAHVVELHPSVRTAVVIVWTDNVGNNRLVTYVVARPEHLLTQRDLREFLRDLLPAYELPSNIIFLPEMPLNANFKVDRRRLPHPSTFAYDDNDATGQTIEVLRAIWKDALHCSDFGDDENFADLGGDSLSAVRVLIAADEHFHCDLPPDTLHRFPTLKLLAECVDKAVRGDEDTNAVTIFQSEGTGAPFFFVAGLGGSAAGYQHVASHLGSLHPTYGLSMLSGFASKSEISVESIAADYVAEIERVIPHGQKVVLIGYSFGGTVAFEIASQLCNRGSHTPLPIVIDMPAVNAPGLRTRSRPRLLLDVLRNLPAWIAHEAVHFHPHAFLMRTRGNLSRVLRSLGILPPANELDPRIYFGEESLPENYQAFLTSMYRAMQAYVPQRYEGRLILLRAKVPTLFRGTDVTMGWQTVAGEKLEVHSIPGRHDDCISEACGPELASVLARCAVDAEAPVHQLV